MISKELAEKLIDRVSKYTEYNVNIMDERGIIIASCDKERVGKYHEVAWQIVSGTEDIVDTRESRDYPNVRPGINMVISVDGEREGVVGVTGDPEQIRPIAQMVKLSIETMLNFERQQETRRMREDKKSRFFYLLTQAEHADPGDLRRCAKSLGYKETELRIPVYLRFAGTSADELLQKIRGSAFHTKKDFSTVLDENHILIFKSLPQENENLLADYKYILGEYLSPLLRSFQKNGKPLTVFLGSFQTSFAMYRQAFRHCLFLEEHIDTSGHAVYFYDHVGEYLLSCLPQREMQSTFYFHEKLLPQEKLDSYRDMIEALMLTNYNFGKAAERLYIHKNTLVYRYNRLKELLDIDPLASTFDRCFLEAFYAYLRR